MKRLVSHSLILASLLPIACCAAQAQRFEFVSLCKVLEAPQAYANKKISLRGSIYIGMESTNVSDGSCPGRAIALKVGDDVYEHADIRDFHRKISGWKMHGYATVSGIFTISDSPLTPYVLDVKEVSNVTKKR